MFGITHLFRRVLTAGLRAPQTRTRLRLDPLEAREAPGNALLGGLLASGLMPGQVPGGVTIPPPGQPPIDLPLFQDDDPIGLPTAGGPRLPHAADAPPPRLKIKAAQPSDPASFAADDTPTGPTANLAGALAGTTAPSGAFLMAPVTSPAVRATDSSGVTVSGAFSATNATPALPSTTTGVRVTAGEGADTPALAPTLTAPQAPTAPAQTVTIAPSKTAAKTTHHYIADGRPVGLNIHPDRVAIGTTEANAVVTEGGLQLVRRLNPTLAVYEASGIGSDAGRTSLARVEGVAFTVPVFTQPGTRSEAVVVRDVIVALKPGVTAAEFFDGNPLFTAHRPLLGTSDQFVATAAAGYGEAALALSNSLPGDSRVAWACPDFYQTWQKFYTPNDPRFGDQWHLHNTGQGGGLVDADPDLPEAWDVNQGGSPNITIAIVDDGIVTNHPDLLNWVNTGEVAGNFFDDDGNGWVDDINGWNFVANNNNASNQHEDDAHGTSVAGVAAARGDNGIGVAGAAYKSQVFSARIFNGGVATNDSNIASALYYSAGRTANGLGTWKAADIVNNSWGGGTVSNAINDALTWGTTNGRLGQGATYFFATGNGFSPSVIYPANRSAVTPGVIAVGATTNTGTRSDYSNYGPEVDVVAPSDGGTLTIDTTDRLGADGYDPSDYTGTGGNGFGGTSSATPLAAGIGALVLAQADVLDVDLTPAQLRALLRNNTDLIDGAIHNATTGKNLEYGFGQLNAFTAVSGVGNREISVTTATADLVSGVSVVNFGGVIIGQSHDITLRVRNQGTVPLDLTGLSVASGPFTITSGFGDSTLDIGESTTLALRFTPTTGGLIDRTLTLTSNDADEGSFTLTLRGTGLVVSIGGAVYEDWDGDGTRDPNDPGVAGRVVYIDANSNGVLDTTPAAPLTNSTSVPINDLSTATSSVTASGLTGSVASVRVTVNLNHTFDSDLVITLISPAGTRVTLFDQRGGDGNNLVNTIFDDTATNPISAGTAPFTGTFRPESPLAGLTGEAPNGTWTLEVDDIVGGDSGTINNWTLNLTYSEPSAFTDAVGNYAFLNLANGPYTVRKFVPTDWVGTGAASHTVTVTGPDDSFLGRNFGTAKNNRFYGYVYNDANGNGTQDGGETPVAGRTLFHDLNNTGMFEPPATNTVSTGPISVGILDKATVTSSLNVSGLSGVVLDVNVRVNLNHTFDGDLVLTLISPTGTRVTLSDRNGGSGENFVNTIFDDEASTSIIDGDPPYTGSFQPEVPLTAVDGIAPNGTWKLEIADQAGGDVGTLTEWAVIVTTQEPSVVTNALGDGFFDLPGGSHTVRMTPLAGWSFTNPADGKYAVTAAGAPLYDQRFGTQLVPAPALNQVRVNGTTIPSASVTFSRATSLQLTFNTAVTVQAGAFSLTNGLDTITSGAGGAISVSGSGTNTLTLTFTGSAGVQSGSLADGIWTLTTDLSKVRNVFDVGGSGTATTLNIRRLYGDADANGTVDLTDFGVFGNAFGQSSGDPGWNPAMDFDANNTIDLTDFGEFGNRFGQTL